MSEVSFGDPLPALQKEANLVEPPEAIANPPLGNLKLIYSTPVYQEWSNGNLLRHIRAVLSQQLPKGSAIESNYIFNIGGWGADQKWTGQFAVEKDTAEGEREEGFDFLKKIVEVQKLALNSQVDSVSHKKLSEIIEGEDDPLVKDVLRMAKEKANQIAVSAVNIKDTNQLIGMDYITGSNIAGFRSVGFDYAYKRLTDDEAVFLMNDADTVPTTNHFVRQLLDVYSENPKLKYVFLGMAYLPPGENKDLVSNSLYESGSRTVGYNYMPMGSPQISFRKSIMETMQGIATGNEHYEDYETVRRLRNFYGGIQNGLLMHDAVFIPTHFTTERSTGFVDGAGRKLGVQVFNDVFIKAKGDMGSLFKTIEGFDETTKAQVNQELEIVRKLYCKQQRLLLRFNKLIVGSFLKNLSLGNIVIQNGEVNLNEQSILQKGRNAFARPLLTFVRANKELVASLTMEDLALMKYYVAGSEFPPSIKELSLFHAALREYLGDYPKEETSSIEELEKLSSERGLTDKTTIYQPFVAEILALGNIASRFIAEESEYKERRIHMTKNLAERSTWLDTALPKAETSHTTDKTADSKINRFIAKFMPFGFLAQFLSKRNKK